MKRPQEKQKIVLDERVLRTVIDRLPEPSRMLESVAHLTKAASDLADHLRERGRPPARLDNLREHFAGVVAPMMPCLSHSGGHGTDTCNALRKEVASELVDSLSSRGALEKAAVTYRGKTGLVELAVCTSIPAAASRLLAPLLKAAREEVPGGDWQGVVARLVANEGQAEGRTERRVKQRVEEAWKQVAAPPKDEAEASERWRGLQQGTWPVLSARVVLDGQSHVKRGLMRHMSRQDAEALSKSKKRLRKRCEGLPLEDVRRLVEQGYEKGRLLPYRTWMRQKWGQVHRYVALVASVWLKAAKDSRKNCQSMAELLGAQQPSWEGKQQGVRVSDSAKAQRIRDWGQTSRNVPRT